MMTRYIAGLSLGVLLATAVVAAQGLQPSADDLRLEVALEQYRHGRREEALRDLAGWSRPQAMNAPRTFHRTLTGQLLLKAGADAAPTRFALGLMFVEAGLEAFVRDDEDLSGAFLAIAHVWLTRHLGTLPDISNDLVVPATMAEDVCVVAVGPLVGTLQLDAARKAWKLCPPQVQARPRAMVLRGSIEELAGSERMNLAAHFYVPGATYGPGGVPTEGEVAIDRLTLHEHDARARLWGRRFRLRLLREAVGWYAKALAADPQNAMARLRWAYVKWQLDDERDAAEGFPWLLDPSHRVPADVRYLANLFAARAAAEARPPQEARAIALYEQAIRIMPKCQVAYFSLSGLKFHSDRAEAARLVRQAVTRPSDDVVDPWFNYDMEFAFQAAHLLDRRYREVQGPDSDDQGARR